jgi:hypothetical protein
MDKKNLIIIIFTTLVSCANNSDRNLDDDIKVLHNNITLIGDLTNRLSLSKPLHDTVVINRIIDVFWSQENLYSEKKTGHEDRMSFLRMGGTNSWIPSKDELNIIDLGDFEGDNYERNRYIKGLDSVQNNLSVDVDKFKKTIAFQYENINTAGGYLLGLLNNLDNGYLAPEKYLKGDSTFGIFHFSRDVLVIFTDGYIEFGQYGRGDNSLSRKLVTEIRKKMTLSGMTAVEASKDLGFEIAPISNKGMTGAEVFILETNDLSYKNGNPMFQPDDHTIYSEIWKDWLIRSGASSVTIRQPFSTKADVEKFVKSTLLTSPKKSI